MYEKSFDCFVGQKLKSLRLIKGLSQTALSEILKISFQQVQKYETGANTISTEKLLLVANYFNVGISYFLPENGNILEALPFHVSDKKESELLKAFSKIKSPELRKACVDAMQIFVYQDEAISKIKKAG